MRKRKFMFGTVAAVILVIILFTSFHFYNYLTIQSMTFTDEWGRGVLLGENTIRRNPLMEYIDGNLLVCTFNKDNSINYYLSEENGNVIKNDTVRFEHYNVQKKNNIFLLGTNLFIVENEDLYLSTFSKQSGFTNPKKIMTNIPNAKVDLVNGRYIIQSFNDEEIVIYELIDNEAVELITLDNNWDTKQVIYKSFNGEEYGFIVHNSGPWNREILALNIKNGKIVDSEPISNDKMTTRTDFGKVQIEELNGKIYYIFRIRVEAQGEMHYWASIGIVDLDSMKEEYKEDINGDNIPYCYYFGNEYFLHANDDKMYLVTYAGNGKNKYASSWDVFQAEIDSDGTISEPVFLTNSFKDSIEPTMINTEAGQYLSWLDLETGKYMLNINSTNKKFIELNEGLTASDYKQAFIKALVAPIIAIPYFIFTSFITILITLLIFIFLNIIFKKLRYENVRVKTLISIALYMIINYITFNSSFYTGQVIRYMPDILLNSTVQLIVPLVINSMSGILLFIFSKERKDYGFNEYAIFFIVINVYLNNLLFSTFALMGKLFLY